MQDGLEKVLRTNVLASVALLHTLWQHVHATTHLNVVNMQWYIPLYTKQ